VRFQFLSQGSCLLQVANLEIDQLCCKLGLLTLMACSCKALEVGIAVFVDKINDGDFENYTVGSLGQIVIFIEVVLFLIGSWLLDW